VGFTSTSLCMCPILFCTTGLPPVALVARAPPSKLDDNLAVSCHARRDAGDRADDTDPPRKSDGARHKKSAHSNQPGSGAACGKSPRAGAADEGRTAVEQGGSRLAASSGGQDTAKASAGCDGRGMQAQRDQQRPSRGARTDACVVQQGGGDSLVDQVGCLMVSA
jgi:hypothetical protein